MPKTVKKTSPLSTKKPQNKSAFVRSLPKDMPAAQVVAKAKAAGIELNDKYVWNIRAAAKATKKTPAVRVSKKATPVPANKTSEPTTKKPASKTAFVLSLPKVSATEVVAKAKAQGIELTDKYVYNIRATARSAAKKKVSAAKVAVVTSKKPVAVVKTKTTAEDLLKAIAAEIGLGRAMEILQQQRAQVRAVLGG